MGPHAGRSAKVQTIYVYKHARNVEGWGLAWDLLHGGVLAVNENLVLHLVGS